MKTELTHNATGYFLVILGVACVGFGGHVKSDKIVETGAGLVSAGLLSFQRSDKSSPETPASPKV